MKMLSYEQLERTYNWNTLRGNTPDTLNWALEISMLQEELDELKDAANSSNNVGIFDALMDLKFVLQGSEYKFGLTPAMSIKGYEAVLQANETKAMEKSISGKIMKPDNFVGPEAKLQEILDER